MESQKSLFISNSHEFQNIVHRCTELKKQIDSYAKKAEEVKVNQKDSKQAENKANIIEQLGQLSVILYSTYFTVAKIAAISQLRTFIFILMCQSSLLRIFL